MSWKTFLKKLSDVRKLTTFYLAENDHRWVTFISLKTINSDLRGLVREALPFLVRGGAGGAEVREERPWGSFFGPLGTRPGVGRTPRR